MVPCQGMGYPHYIIQWREGRLSCPAHLKACGAIRKQFERGTIGGSKLHERRFQERRETVLEVRRLEHDRRDPEVFLVKAPNSPRQRVRL